ncbi:MAG TPA: hypothetical protein VFY79_07675 [Dehalococcoidia bacterium]|nr:hypothetical protein [Dehalococcoidia bacterium]
MAVDGTWNLTLNTPMGAQTPTLTLAANGDALTGKLDGPQGAADIEDGKVEGNDVSWAITVPQMAMTITFKGTVSGDSMKGNASLGAFGDAPFEGTRA